MVQKIYTTKQLIERFIEVHGNAYDYSKVILEKSYIPVIIICSIHGEFSQLYHSHLAGKGCKLCYGDILKTTDQYILEAIAVHGDRYDYSLVDYRGNKIKIKISCKEHGIFEQEAKSHIHGHGCDRCGMGAELNADQFIQKAKEIHGDTYIYDKTFYIRSYKSVIITCRKHGDFKQRPNGHLSGKGCRKCTKNISKPEIQWLDYLGVKEEYRAINFRLNGILYRLDAYDVNTNTIYEFYGDYWHGNINNEKFKFDDLNKVTKKTYGELYQKTINRENNLIADGYNVISIWESDWKKIEKELNKIK